MTGGAETPGHDAIIGGTEIAGYDVMTGFTTVVDTLSQAMKSYNDVTDRLCEVQFPEIPAGIAAGNSGNSSESAEHDEFEQNFFFAIDDIETFLQEREEIGEVIDTAYSEMLELYESMKESQEPDDDTAQKQAEKILAGVIETRDEITEKNEQLTKRWSVQLDAIKKVMKNLQGDRKKLNYLSATAVNPGSGGQESSGINV